MAAVLFAELFLLEQELREACDRREGIVQLVGHARHELPDGRELLALYELRLEGLLVGDVFDEDDDALLGRGAGDARRVYAERPRQTLGPSDERGRAISAARRREE